MQCVSQFNSHIEGFRERERVPTNLIVRNHHIDGSKGGYEGCEGCATPPQSKFLKFHAVFENILQNRMWRPPGGLALPPWGNPGSATASVCFLDVKNFGLLCITLNAQPNFSNI